MITIICIGVGWFNWYNITDLMTGGRGEGSPYGQCSCLRPLSKKHVDEHGLICKVCLKQQQKAEEKAKRKAQKKEKQDDKST